MLDRMTVNTDQFGFDGNDGTEGKASGFAGATEVALGATITSGLAVGLGLYTNIVPAASAETDLSGEDYAFDESQLAMLAAFADYYLFEKSGLHFQGGVGLATFVMGTGRVDDEMRSAPTASAHTGLGTGVMLGAGYEAWVGQQWSMGVLGRMTRGFTGGNDSRWVHWEHDTIGWALLLSITNN